MSSQEQSKENVTCDVCDAPFVPDEWLNEHTETMEWDGHTYRATCSHYPEDAVLSIG